MKFAVFNIFLRNPEPALGELNQFLQAHRITHVERRMVDAGENSVWTFCVEYVTAPTSAAKPTPTKVDYKEILSPEHFARFSKLRALRKTLAEKESIPAYTIFTNEQLAQMAKLDPPSKQALEGISGVGGARIEKYGEAFLAAFKGEVHETSRKPDANNRDEGQSGPGVLEGSPRETPPA